MIHTPVKITQESLKEMDNFEINELYSHYNLLIKLYDEKKLNVGEESEFKTRTSFRLIKMEYQSRFPFKGKL